MLFDLKFVIRDSCNSKLKIWQLVVQDLKILWFKYIYTFYGSKFQISKIYLSRAGSLSPQFEISMIENLKFETCMLENLWKILW